MANLGRDLRDTIRNLENIRDKQKPPGKEILAQIDTLYGQQIELVNAAINNATVEYAAAAKAMKKAANQTKKAIDDLTKVEETTAKVANAIKKVANLLAAV